MAQIRLRIDKKPSQEIYEQWDICRDDVTVHHASIASQTYRDLDRKETANARLPTIYLPPAPIRLPALELTVSKDLWCCCFLEIPSTSTHFERTYFGTMYFTPLTAKVFLNAILSV